ncbi:MAG: hypothetical protein RL398_1358 [Planctomycetota bacterium]|jgi:GPH family glycoside/pentoside/hexuronide:cation symporter
MHPAAAALRFVPLNSPQPASGQLPVARQIGYSIAETGINTVETLVRIYLLIFYTDEVGLGPGLASLAFGLGVVWDAVTDPMMGAISDRTRHRFGGRRGYLLPGSVLLAGSLLLVFFPPPIEGQFWLFLWLLGSYCALNLGMTVLSVPYMAMAGELTEDPRTRAALFGWRFAFANVGAVAAVALTRAFLVDGHGSAAALPTVSMVAAGIVVVSALVTWRATAAMPRLGRVVRTESWLRTLRTVFASRPLRPLLAAYVVATIGIGINATTAQYYYRYLLRLDAAQVESLLLVFLAVFTVSILGWVTAAKHYPKLRLMSWGSILLGIGTAALYLLLPPGAYLATVVLGGVVLGSLVGCIVLIDATLTDVIDHDRLRTGQLRSGLYFGLWRFASKLARALSIGTAGLVLDVAGFVPNVEQSEGVQWALRLQFGPGVGLFFALAGVILGLYRFDERKQDQVRRLLARREAG